MSRNNQKVRSKRSQKVFVAMSGGVDSSVAALLLRDRGYDVTGVFVRCYNVDGCLEKEASDARRAAAHLGIPFYVFDFEEEYKRRVVEYMIDGYRRGITPNPDVMCNKEIKFGLFLEKALALGADYAATGHYVKIKNSKIRNQNGKSKFKIIYRLFAAKDFSKDQSYFLWTLTQEQLKYCLFPIGDYLKSEVREIARKAGLPTADKKDSQGICFLGKVALADFLKNYIPERRGAVLTTAGEKVGEHEGAEFYTIGQRRLGVGGLSKPHYVAKKDLKTNTVVIAEEGSLNLYQKETELANVNFINPIANSKFPITVYARVRYRQPFTAAELCFSRSAASNNENSSAFLRFYKPVKFIAPGQSAVFYSKKGELLGGGIIK